MSALAPLLCFVLAQAMFLPRHGPRSALLRASVLWGVLVVISTEIMSLFHAVSATTLVAFWLAGCVVLACICWRQRHLLAATFTLRCDRDSALFVAATLPVIAIAGVTALIALIAPPNTWDSMTYHMARVSHWSANHTLAHYPTNISRQLWEPPWAEYTILHFQVLIGGDRLANLVQWFSMVGSLIGVSLIARELRAPPRGQVFAAVFAATLPIGILEATSTQNDYVVAFWLVACVFFALRFARNPTVAAAAFLGASVGLALLSKGTAYLFLTPLLLVIGGWGFWKLRRAALRPALLVITIALAINGGFFTRNQVLFGNPLGLAADRQLVSNASFSPRVLASNFIRDIAVQMGTPSGRVNMWLTRRIMTVHASYIGVDVDDPRTTYPGATFQVFALTTEEDYAGNPLHLLALALAGFVAAILAMRRRHTVLVLYLSCLLGGFLLFAFSLKWQPWLTRLELPVLMLGAPLCGAVFALLGGRAVLTLGSLLIIASMPWLVDNQSRPLMGYSMPLVHRELQRYLSPGETIFSVPRNDLYFVKRPALRDPYKQAVQHLKGLHCRDVALWSGGDDWEYPLWALTDPDGQSIHIQQVFVDNVSRSATTFGFQPCAVVTINSPDRAASLDVNHHHFVLHYSAGPVGLYKEDPGRYSRSDTSHVASSTNTKRPRVKASRRAASGQ